MLRADPIFVASAPRCGSSLTAAVIASHGVLTGITKPADEWNVRGYVENEWVEEQFAKVLQHNDRGKRGRRFWPLSVTIPHEFRDFDHELEGRLMVEGITSRDRWMLKSVKLPWLWSFMQPFYPRAKWVIVERDREPAIQSLLRTPFMTQCHTAHGWNAMLDRYEQAFKLIDTNTWSMRFNISRAMDPSLGVNEWRRLHQWLGVPFRASNVRALTVPEVWHG